MHDFTPVHAIAGGALIASSLAIMLIATGQIAGLSGIVAQTLRASFGWHAWFVAGMLGVGAVVELAAPSTFDVGARVPLWLVAVSGVLVGIGTRASNGCTSGHGLCGMSRLSRRSIVATLSFFSVGVVTATIVGALVGHG
jgi:uncharacterized membrane protein YedE/YeeE